MKENKKNALMTLAGGMAVVVLLGGIWGLYSFNIGLLGAIALWVVFIAIHQYYAH
ncbi:MAG: hypothetical protein KO217_05950 [Methanobacteriaceae archaeon]|jgi:hypothetical protein|nr:hypothetical protein [Methanobacteriaceae archaeon]